MNDQNKKAWLYLLPALIFLILFMVYPLIDVSSIRWRRATILPPRPIMASVPTTIPTSCTIPISCRR